MKTTIPKTFLSLGLLFCALCCSAQNSSEETPYWVSVMDNDSTANYFQAVESFSGYWKTREIPMENDEYMDDDRREKKLKRNREIRERRREKNPEMENNELKYTVEFKKFLRWKEEMIIFVRPDGTIPSMEERIKIINEQR